MLRLGRPRARAEPRGRARSCPGPGSAGAGKIRYVGNGVVLDRFTAPVDRPASASARPIVVMVSRLVREKGCTDFLALARTLHGRADFVHVGPVEPDQRDALSAAEIAAAVGDVSFVGAVDDVRPYLAAADVVVLPSYREGMPRVAMEAAAAGRPVVAYDVRGVREVDRPRQRVSSCPGATPCRPGRRWSTGSAARTRARRAALGLAVPGTRPGAVLRGRRHRRLRECTPSWRAAA